MDEALCALNRFLVFVMFALLKLRARLETMRNLSFKVHRMHSEYIHYCLALRQQWVDPSQAYVTRGSLLVACPKFIFVSFHFDIHFWYCKMCMELKACSLLFVVRDSTTIAFDDNKFMSARDRATVQREFRCVLSVCIMAKIDIESISIRSQIAAILPFSISRTFVTFAISVIVFALSISFLWSIFTFRNLWTKAQKYTNYLSLS